MKCRYCKFSKEQIAGCKEKMRKKIFFLLLLVDPDTKGQFDGMDVDSAFEDAMLFFGGINGLMGSPVEITIIMSLLDAARVELHSPNFRYSVYRKLVLEAGNEVLKIKEV